MNSSPHHIWALTGLAFFVLGLKSSDARILPENSNRISIPFQMDYYAAQSSQTKCDSVPMDYECKCAERSTGFKQFLPSHCHCQPVLTCEAHHCQCCITR
eukprot:TCALIF_12199-PA protein Name:"Protein of unknown function" AED:0.08 eAED:0.08 QI:0/1/0.33/1/0/0.33/3/0/99